MAQKTSKKEFLSFFRNLCEVSKTNLIAELSKAAEQGAFKFESDLDRQRFFALFETIYDNENSDTYLKLEKLTK